MRLQVTTLGLLLLSLSCTAQSGEWAAPDADPSHQEILMSEIPVSGFMHEYGSAAVITPLVHLIITDCGAEAEDDSVTVTRPAIIRINGHINSLVVFAPHCFLTSNGGATPPPLLHFEREPTAPDAVIESLVFVGGMLQLQSIFTHTTNVKIDSVSFYDAVIYNSALNLGCVTNCPVATTLVHTHVI
jgi:hypothetical protein